ncbi:MAG TPA: metallophosphoesterase, partial [Beijerinckiaceae bacterium]
MKRQEAQDDAGGRTDGALARRPGMDAPSPPPAAAAAPPRHLAAAADDASTLYAVGDVHGCADLLDALLAEIARDAGALDRAATVVFLGDLVNRGPDSAGVMRRVTAGPERAGDRWLCLRGNHEQALL